MGEKYKFPSWKSRKHRASIWNNHGSYQWTYFSEAVKQRINFFLSKRLHGRNLDIGGGWYLSYPNSVVLDLSSKCLAYNPSAEKLRFDMDDLGQGSHLPFRDASFDSATLISVWQYLKHPGAVLRELERVLRPGAEVYIINGKGGGLEECMLRSSAVEKSRIFFSCRGYDTVVENIPDMNSDVKEFQSLCVAMPDVDLFGCCPSNIANKEGRIEKNKETCEDPSAFQEEFANTEMQVICRLLSQLAVFPVTQFSQDYLARVETFSQEYHQQSGRIPLCFSEYTIAPVILMRSPEFHEYYSEYVFVMDETAVGKSNVFDDKRISELLGKHGVSMGHHCNYFTCASVGGLLDDCRSLKTKMDKERAREYSSSAYIQERDSFVRFIAAIGLNSFATNLQQQMYSLLKPQFPDLDSRVSKARAFGYIMAVGESKQRRMINRLIEQKRLIKEQGIQVVRKDCLDFIPYIPHIKEHILHEPLMYYDD